MAGEREADPAAAAFTARVRADIAGGVVTLLCSLGDRLGLFADLAARGPVTSMELAGRTGLDERYLREWLAALACAGYLAYDSPTGRFRLPAAHAPTLAEEGALAFRGGMFEQFPALAGALERVAGAVRDGGGVPASAYDARYGRGEERLNAPVHDRLLIQEIIPAVPEVQAALERGAATADVGCGAGRAVIRLARAFPRARFVGYDLHRPSIERARAAAADAGVADRARFEVRDAAAGTDERFALVTTFLAVHDAPDPAALLVGIRGMLSPDGVYLWCLESVESERLEDHVEFGMLGALWYGTSLLYCLPTVRALGGEGLGSMGLPVTRMRALAAQAGFRSFAPVAIPSGLTDVVALRP